LPHYDGLVFPWVDDPAAYRAAIEGFLDAAA
jgi:hypothetical protein